MERLTYRTELGVSIDKNENCPTCSICWDCDTPPKKCDHIDGALKKLADYEDLEEQGRFIKLPCKCGDVVYVTEPALVEAMCIRIQLDGYKNGIWINAKEYPYDRWVSFKAFGKTVFLTESEAEAKLKELRDAE